MNILVLSAGTRNKIVQYFKKLDGMVIATDINGITNEKSSAHMKKVFT